MENVTIDNKIAQIILGTRCKKHMRKGVDIAPCWYVPSPNGTYYPAVCNDRAERAGFFGKIDPRSMRTSKR